MTAQGLAATDVFLAATGALLLVLAIAAPYQPQRLQIQADIVATCNAASEPPILTVWATAGTIETDEYSQIALEGLADLPGRLGLTPRLQYTVALVPDAAGTLPMACVSHLRDGLLRPHNASLSRPDALGPVYTLSVVTHIGDQ